MTNLASRIKEAFADLKEDYPDASESRVAKEAGLSQPTFNDLKNDLQKSTGRMVQLARALRVDPEWLAEGIGSKRRLSQSLEIASVKEGAVTYRMPARKLSQDEWLIPQLQVQGSMGDGAYPLDHVDTVRTISVSVPELRKQCSFSSPKNLHFITGYGDSMEPTYRDGDLLLVDAGITSLEIDGVHVVMLNDRLYIKTLQRSPDGNVWMISDNKKYQPYLITEKDQVAVQGRVVLAWNARRL